MTNEKLNELKEVVEKAGKCKIVAVTVNGTSINFFIVMDDIVMYEAEGDFSSPGMRICTSKTFFNFEHIWFADHPDLTYKFQCDNNEERVIVTYCNGEIATTIMK